MTKKEARESMKKLRREMSDQERSRQNQEIREQLLADPVWREVSWFYPFVSYGTEVDTRELIRGLLAEQKQGRRIHVAVPRVAGREMDFYEIHDLARFEGTSLHLYAVAYDFQIVDHIETEEHDISPHRIITSQNKHN